MLSEGDIASYSGTSLMIICVALSTSLGMSLRRPPNALAHATGLVASKDFIRTGKFISTICVMLIFLTMTLLGTVGYFNSLEQAP